MKEEAVNTPVLPDEKVFYHPNDILKAAMDVSAYMLECGGETHRIEDTAERICRAYGAEVIEIFAMSTLITATITMPDGRSATQIRRVYENNNIFYKIEKLNALSRRICACTPNPLEVEAEVAKLRKTELLPNWLMILGPLLGAGGFAIFFGGTLLEAVIAAVIGLLIQKIVSKRPSYLNSIAYTVIVSIIAGILISAVCKLPLPAHVDAINIGVIMLLIPGLALSNAVRDLICGEVVAGLVKTAQCILIAAAIAVGFALALVTFGEEASIPISSLHPVILVIVAGIATIGFSIIFGVRPKWLVYEWLGGMFSTAVYFFVLHLYGSETTVSLFVASVCAGVLSTLCSEVLARVNKTPTTVFLLPSLIPLVPGGSLYYTVANLVSGNKEMAYIKGSATLYISLGISAGIVVVSVIWQIAVHLRLRAKKAICCAQRSAKKKSKSEEGAKK